MEKLNIAEILKDCPKGMELNCTMCDDIYLDEVTPQMIKCLIKNNVYNTIYFHHDGTYLTAQNAKCVIFPKGKTTWEGFQRPLNDGDIIVCVDDNEDGKEYVTQMFMFKSQTDNNKAFCYTGYDFKLNVFFNTGNYVYDRIATEEEKQKLFQVIKDNGYKWNPETKTLEKLAKFKAGDVLVSNYGNIVLCSHIDDKQVVHYHCLLRPSGSFMIKSDTGVGKSLHCTLATSAEKQKLFDKLTNAGYKYNPQTNKLEKLIEPKFKVGDRIKSKYIHKDDCAAEYTIIKVYDEYYKTDCGILPFENQDDYKLVPNKFDITTLREFDKVLVRDNDKMYWSADIYSHHLGKDKLYQFVCIGGMMTKQCIPYESNEHLLGTTNNCEEYFKTWE